MPSSWLGSEKYQFLGHWFDLVRGEPMVNARTYQFWRYPDPIPTTTHWRCFMQVCGLLTRPPKAGVVFKTVRLDWYALEKLFRNQLHTKHWSSDSSTFFFENMCLREHMPSRTFAFESICLREHLPSRIFVFKNIFLWEQVSSMCFKDIFQ